MTERSLVIRNHVIADDEPAYVLCEIGSNHQGDIETAKHMIKAAAENGASGVKLQKRDNASLFSQAMADEPYTGKHGFGPTYRKHREALEFDELQHVELLHYAHRCGVDYLCTAFDLPSLTLLDAIGVDGIKIASGDMLTFPLVDAAFETGRPVIISTGGWDFEQVCKAVDHYDQHGAPYALLHCTAEYPCPYEQTAIRVIESYRQCFNAVIGYSGHEMGWGIMPAVYALGARVIEKHYTLDRTWKGADQHFSILPSELREMTRALEQTRCALMMGGEKVAQAGESRAMSKLGKSIYTLRDLTAGHVLTGADVCMKSPMVAGGITADRFSDVIGRTLSSDVSRDAALFFDGELQVMGGGE